MVSIFSGLMLTGVTVLEYIATAKYSFSIIDVALCALCVLVTSTAVFVDTQVSIPNDLERITTVSNSIVLISFSLSIVPLTLSFGYLGPVAALFFSELLGVSVMIYMHVFKYKTHIHRDK
ncbi:hypothetical protein D3C87_886850 [compost metagenome]